MVRENSRYVAGRVMDVAGADVEEQVEQVYLAALSRRPSAEERKYAGDNIRNLTRYWLEHLEKEIPAEPKEAKAEWLALATFCHTILNSADFIYID